jgi:putative transferase (TIGR04331 family)
MLISTYNSTTYLESFTADFPTIIFWNPKHWELRDTAKPYFDDLQRVGILHYTPESAAAKVNEIYYDPVEWWQKPEIQEVKNRFCDQFARTRKNWINEWKIVLKSMDSR